MGRDGQDFAAVRGTGLAVRVGLGQPSPFGRLVMSDGDPETAVAAVRAAAGV